MGRFTEKRRLACYIRVMSLLLAYRSVGLLLVYGSMDYVEERPIRQFMHCAELVKLKQQEGLPFDSLIKLDPYKTWLELGLWEKHYSYRLEDSDLFRFSIEGQSYGNYTIKSTNLVGGRSYLFDPRWLCKRLVFVTNSDRELIAPWIKTYFNRELAEYKALAFFLALPYPEGIVHPPNQIEPEERAMALRTISEYLGDFLHLESMRDFVFDVAFSHEDVTTRVQCIRSMLSVFESLPAEVQKELKDRVERRKVKIQTSPETERELKYLTYLHKKLLAENPSLIVPDDR